MPYRCCGGYVVVSRLIADSSPNRGERKSKQGGNNVEDNENGESVSKRKRKLEGMPNVDTEETSDTGRSSKKKHKIKQVDNYKVNGDHSLTNFNIPADHSATLEDASQHVAVKTRKDKDKHASIMGSAFNNSDGKSTEEEKKTPNEAFYDSHYEEPPISRPHVKNQQKNNGNNANTIETKLNGATIVTDSHETQNEGDDCALSTNTDSLSRKPKRKRIRKRKRPETRETSDELSDNIAPNIVSSIRPVSSTLSRANSKHIFFPEVVGEDLQTSGENSGQPIFFSVPTFLVIN